MKFFVDEQQVTFVDEKILEQKFGPIPMFKYSTFLKLVFSGLCGFQPF